MLTLTINGKAHEVDVPNDMPLLWVLRDVVGLTGTKYGCGSALCGACSVLIDNQPARACVLPVSETVGKSITTVEGLHGAIAETVQHAWIAEQVPQCGYCQSGQIVNTVALLATNNSPTDQDIDTALAGNLCRCGTYQRVRAAVHSAAAQLKGKQS